MDPSLRAHSEARGEAIQKQHLDWAESISMPCRPSAPMKCATSTLRTRNFRSDFSKTRLPLIDFERGYLVIEADCYSHAFAGAVSTLRSVLVFSRKVWTISAPIFPGTGQMTSAGKPIPSSATTTRYRSSPLRRHSSVMTP